MQRRCGFLFTFLHIRKTGSTTIYTTGQLGLGSFLLNSPTLTAEQWQVPLLIQARPLPLDRTKPELNPQLNQLFPHVQRHNNSFTHFKVSPYSNNYPHHNKKNKYPILPLYNNPQLVWFNMGRVSMFDCMLPTLESMQSNNQPSNNISVQAK